MNAPLDAVGWACLFAGSPRVDGLRALHEWADAIDELVRLGTTEAHTVAHHKLQWWREEQERLATGQPRHPLTQRLVRAAPEPGLWNCLAERLELAQFELAGVAPDDEAAAARWDWRREGVLQATAWQLLTGVPWAENGPAEAFIRPLGRLLGRLAATESPALHAARGRLGLPLAALESAGIPLDTLPGALRDPARQSGLQSVVATELAVADKALVAASSAWGELSRDVRRQVAYCAVRLALAARQLHRRQDQAPWRSLWVAWNAARRAGSR